MNSPGRISTRLVDVSIDRPKTVLWVAAAVTLVTALGFLRLSVDTDPENMLADDHPVRVLNAEVGERFGIGDMIAVGVTAPEGDTMVTADRLDAVVALHRDVTSADGVDVDVDASVSLALAVDGPIDDAESVAATIAADPLLGGNVLTADGRTAALFLALDDGDDATGIRDELERLVAADPNLSPLDLAIAGLPLAQQAFGQQMFVQMALFAPLAGLLIFVLMWLFFRRLGLVVPAMLLSMLTVTWTMGLLTGTGNTLHIMSSMLPIFLMPIAILDSVHVLSEFFDLYPHSGDRAGTLRHVYRDLQRPLAFTSLTTAVGFGSLALAPIPPVQVFGIFVAVGVAIAWLLTLTLLPAFVMVSNEQRLARELADGEQIEAGGRLGRLLAALGRSVVARRRVLLVGFLVVGAIAIPALTQIEVNDNPVRWFRADQEIRRASEELNERLPGTFGASLVVRTEPGGLVEPDVIAVVAGLDTFWAGDAIVGTASTYTDLVAADPASAAETLAVARVQSPIVSTLVTDDLSTANLRLQLRSGDNQAMRAVVDRTEAHLESNPLPAGVVAEWAGESYLNAEWQDEMVSGMLVAFLSTLGVILVLMLVLFRSVVWALLAVAPVLWTVLVVYGAIGAVGKDYDMPIAVLSTMVLGIGVDFAIHYVERFRQLRASVGVDEARVAFFGEPARALTRNALIIAIGFTPLFLSSLVPYVVVGAFLAAIIVLSWLVTIVGLPAVTSSVRRT
ncbi:efflux RND transporter permease subunit [Ilumatobacter sp.]|uniref:efflux RND transporter permease subunit n=1 Tax=Ilumatobacter sp. TaxID=1967498 RepID=UPI003AF701D1